MLSINAWVKHVFHMKQILATLIVLRAFPERLRQDLPEAGTRLVDRGIVARVEYLDFAKLFNLVNHKFMVAYHDSFGKKRWPSDGFDLINGKNLRGASG